MPACYHAFLALPHYFAILPPSPYYNMPCPLALHLGILQHLLGTCLPLGIWTCISLLQTSGTLEGCFVLSAAAGEGLQGRLYGGEESCMACTCPRGGGKLHYLICNIHIRWRRWEEEGRTGACATHLFAGAQIPPGTPVSVFLPPTLKRGPCPVTGEELPTPFHAWAWQPPWRRWAGGGQGGGRRRKNWAGICRQGHGHAHLCVACVPLYAFASSLCLSSQSFDPSFFPTTGVLYLSSTPGAVLHFSLFRSLVILISLCLHLCLFSCETFLFAFCICLHRGFFWTHVLGHEKTSEETVACPAGASHTPFLPHLSDSALVYGRIPHRTPSTHPSPLPPHLPCLAFANFN